MTSNLGKRVFKHGFAITTAILTCTALQADHTTQAAGDKAQQFIQKAAMGGQMEVQMGQLGEQKAQSQQVKDLAALLVRDHTAANQQLQQIASAKNITLETSATDTSATYHARPSADTSVSTSTSGSAHTGEVHANLNSGKEHRELAKLEKESGAQFDKTFVRMAIKDHKKDISEFERARTEVTDPQVTSFIDQTLPKLRNHLQMAQTAAKAVGVSEASTAADREEDTSAAGAAATSDIGTRGSDKPSSPASNPANDKQTSSYSGGERYNGHTDADASGTVQQNTSPNADLNANVGDHNLSATAGTDNSSASTSSETTKKHKIFSTDKNDGKFLGIIPDPWNKDHHKGASTGADVNVNGNNASVGASAGSESSSSSSSDQK